MIGGGGPCLFSVFPGTWLTLRKITENLCQGSLLVLDSSRCVDLAALLGAASTSLLSIGSPRLHVSNLSHSNLPN
jgi:hypothetical protein